MLRSFIIAFVGLLGCPLFAQTNFVLTHPAAEAVLLGNYVTGDYSATTVLDDPALIASELSTRISPDSLKSYITTLSLFGNRNSGSDTVSQVRGIGAARRWTYEKFRSFSLVNENRLLAGYFQFDREMCSVVRHRNILAILPGSDPDPNGVIIIEGHIDSRCAVLCDTACVAEGVEDNATGTALVIELARVMARYTFKNTIVFMVVIGEEQGLYGADAFAAYAKSKNIPIRAVLNNDVIGGVICGKTSSPPSCSGYNDIDSTSVRLFSSGGFNSAHKQLARYIKLEYRENLAASAAIPMNVRIMTPEDRTGRGGDHIPFRERNYPAMRFTAANEHGDASNGPAYDDRQHSSRDILGADTNNDNEVDSFFVQFNYLSRNALINGNAAAMIARAVPSLTGFTGYRSGATVSITLTDPANLGIYRVALRSATNDWDTVYTLTGATSGTFACNATGGLFVSVASVDAQGVESLFSVEKIMTTTGTQDPAGTADESRNIRLFQNKPNPFDEATWISFWVNEVPGYHHASILITDMNGRQVEEIPVLLRQGMNEVQYTHGYGGKGTFSYALMIDNNPVDARKMVFAN
jgi:hypothetical protein